MDIILLERVEKLGQMGDVVTVKPGYARNFLLPRGKALRATEANKKQFEAQRAQLEADNLKLRKEAEQIGEKIDGLSVVVLRQAGDAGQLYGSVNTRDIADAVTAAGFTVDRRQIKLAHPIKSLGLFTTLLQLHPEVAVSITVNVARSAEEAAIQTETGKAVVSVEEEEQQQDITKEVAESAAEEPEAASKEPEAAAKEPKAAAKEPKAAAKEPKAAAKEPKAAAKEPKAASKEPEAAAKEPKAAAKEPEAAAKESKLRKKKKAAPSKEPVSEAAAPETANDETPQESQEAPPPEEKTE